MLSLAGYTRPTLHTRDADPRTTLQWMVRLTQAGLSDVSIRLLAEEIVKDLWPHDYLSEYAAVLNWVRTHVRYTRDPIIIEQVKTPRAIIETGTGDCMPYDTRVIVRDRAGFYRVKALGDLAEDFFDYEALSYNFVTQAFEFKPITAWSAKGEQQTFEVRLTNGYSAHCTRGHKFFEWNSRTEQVTVRTLDDLWRGDGMRQSCTLLYAKQIPALDDVSFWASKDAAWLAGAYLSEGWSESSKVGIAKQDPAERRAITSRLEQLGVPFSESRREKSAYVSVLTHPFKAFLKQFGHRALVKHVPEEGLSASRELLAALLTGYAWGDSWQPDPTRPRRSHQNHVAMHSTVSDQLAEQLKFLYLILGRPLSANHVTRHGGLGKNPIWRLWESAGKQHPLQSSQTRKPACLTSKGVRFVEAIGSQPVCDITVQDNHNFVLSNGLVAHNCDDMCVIIGTLVGTLGGKARYVAGGFRRRMGGEPALSHVWCEAFDPASKKWVVLDPVPGRNVGEMLRRLVDTVAVPAV